MLDNLRAFETQNNTNYQNKQKDINITKKP